MEQEKSKLTKKIVEQISNSQDRENLEEEWKTKLEREKRKHDLELRQLKEEVRTGNQERESLERTIEIEKEYSKKKDELREEACERGAEMSKRMEEMREDACKRGEEARKELEKKALSYKNTKI